MRPMKHLILIAALAAAACSPAPSDAPPTDEAATQAAIAPASGAAFAANTSVVFAGEKALELSEPCSRVRPQVEGTWTPSPAQIEAMEPALAQFAAEQLRAQWPNADDIDVAQYRRQYGGLIIEGRRVIYVNAFQLGQYDDLDAWRSFPHVICDGGPIMFGVEYEPATRSFRNFAFNGVA